MRAALLLPSLLAGLLLVAAPAAAAPRGGEAPTGGPAVSHAAAEPGQPTVAVDAQATGVGTVRVVITVVDADGAPLSGTADLAEGDRVLAKGLELVAGRAVQELTGVSAGQHTFTATYQGGPGVVSASAGVTVAGAAVSTLTLTATSPAVRTVRVVVALAVEAVPASGSVEVREGTKVLRASLAVVAGTATYEAAGLTPGLHTFTVAYAGTAGIAPSTQQVTVQVRDRAAAVLTVSSTSAAVGKLALRVGVTAAGSPVTGGTVTIKEGSKTLKSGLVVSRGSATWSTSGLKSGRHTYVVAYSGTSTVTTGSRTVTATVKAKVKPTVRLSASSPVPNKVSLTVTVTAPGQSGIGGTVTVKEGSKTVKSGLRVSGGKATWSSTGIKAGKHTYSLSYGGTSEVTSGAATVSVTVRAVKTYANCTALNRDYAHGVGRSGARDTVSGQTDPVTDFVVHTGLYNANTKSDRDEDGVACEKQ